jgi:cyanophycinase-like exopeptidase
MSDANPGLVILISSGETASSGGQIFETVVRRLARSPRVAILETPAGFELNSALVAGRVADFLRRRLQNYQPEVAVIPARKRHTPFSPDDAALLQPLLKADLIFMGPGSPTYAVRQLRDCRVWHTLIARQRLGATLVFASAATTAVGTHVLPVYEIYKVGEDPHWLPGLDLFGAYGLSLVLIPHWNNAEGGAELDTSRCFMGQTRLAELLTLLPSGIPVLGIDEHTALTIDFRTAQCEVMGNGGVTLIQAGQGQYFAAGQSFPLTALGSFHLPEPASGIPAPAWEEVLATQTNNRPDARPSVPIEVLALAEERQAARTRRDWAIADELRKRIAASGWNVLDTPDGPRLEPREA